jgi:hypothetical protein
MAVFEGFCGGCEALSGVLCIEILWIMFMSWSLRSCREVRINFNSSFKSSTLTWFLDRKHFET